MDVTNKEAVNLCNIGDGELERQFNKELDKVYKNIMDMETTADARVITIKVGIKPSGDNRNVLQIGFSLARHDAPNKPFATGAMFEREDGRIVAKEFVKPTQQPIPFEVKGGLNDSRSDREN